MTTIRHGFDAKDHDRVTDLYWQAFRDKLVRCMGPDAKGRAFVSRVLNPDFAISAYDGDRLLGVAGFKTWQGALVGGEFEDMRAVYGTLGTLLRGALLGLLERGEDDRFLMDGIFVAPEARGRGVGTALLAEICAEGKRRGYSRVRLDVIDRNTRARALYEREGFEAVKDEPTWPFFWLFGFSNSTIMVKDITNSA